METSPLSSRENRFRDTTAETNARYQIGIISDRPYLESQKVPALLRAAAATGVMLGINNNLELLIAKSEMDDETHMALTLMDGSTDTSNTEDTGRTVVFRDHGISISSAVVALLGEHCLTNNHYLGMTRLQLLVEQLCGIARTAHEEAVVPLSAAAFHLGYLVTGSTVSLDYCMVKNFESYGRVQRLEFSGPAASVTATFTHPQYSVQTSYTVAPETDVRVRRNWTSAHLADTLTELMGKSVQ